MFKLYMTHPLNLSLREAVLLATRICILLIWSHLLRFPGTSYKFPICCLISFFPPQLYCGLFFMQCASSVILTNLIWERKKGIYWHSNQFLSHPFFLETSLSGFPNVGAA